MQTPMAALDLEAAAVPAGSAAVVRAAQQLPAAKVAPETEDPAFVRKIYGILSLQFVLTAAVAATALFVHPVARFFADGPDAAVWPTFVVILVSPLIVMFPMLEYSEKKSPRNRVLLALFTLCCTFSIAVAAFSTVDIAVILRVTILTVLGLTLLAIWTAKTGYDYDICDAFAKLFFSLILVLVCTVVVIPFPLNMVAIAMGVLLATLVLAAFVVVVLDLDDRTAATTTAAATRWMVADRSVHSACSVHVSMEAWTQQY